MAININPDSKVIRVLAAQTRKERVDSADAANTVQ